MKAWMIRNWEQHFETAKSMQIKNKSQAEIPLKQGLAYRRLLAIDKWKGPAMYGCFVAMVCHVSARTRQVRNGYLTETGEKNGPPLSVDDLSVVLMMDREVIQETLDFCTSLSDPWIVTYESMYSASTCQVPEEGAARTLCSSVQESRVQESFPSKSHHPGDDGVPAMESGEDLGGSGSDGGDLTPSGVNSRKKNSGGKWTKAKLDAAEYADYPGFRRWWKQYPRNDGKRAAFEAWLKRGLEDQTPSMLAALAKKKRCRQWLDEDGKYIPHGSTYLNQRMDEDEPEAEGATTGGGIGGRFSHG